MKNVAFFERIDPCIMHMLEQMDETGEPKYIVSPEWARRGMTTFYEDVFKDSCAKGCITFRPSRAIWKSVLFRDAGI